MAVAQRQVEVAAEGEVAVGNKVVDVVVDKENGVIAQKEVVAVAVPNRSGGKDILISERIRAVKIVSN